MGRLVPAGTGLVRYRGLHIPHAEAPVAPAPGRQGFLDVEAAVEEIKSLSAGEYVEGEGLSEKTAESEVAG